MKRSHRAWHLYLWIALTPIAIAIVVMALWARGGGS
jgi:hypothetical protein